MGSVFPKEPEEWFEHRHMVMFSLLSPDLVMHKPSKRCSKELPHQINICGEFKKVEGK
jgi:hypothetical protein